jgi:Carboxypeptidase regulatory-like domain
MNTGLLVARAASLLPLFAVAALADPAVSGRVVDENGAAVAGAAVELRTAGQPPLLASSDLAGHFSLHVPSAGDYAIRVERQGFYLYRSASQHFDESASELTITLNHLQDLSDRIDVTYSPPAIDPTQPTGRKQLDNTEIQSVPYPAPQDYRNALPMMDGVVQDNQGRPHFNGGDTNQTSYALDGFNIADPVTGTLETRLNIDTIQSMEALSSRFSAENGRGSSGALDLHTKMGDDRWRLGGTNFIPGASNEGGLHVNKWTPRLELSGPLDKGRSWVYQGVDLFYSNDTVPGLPRGQNRTSGVTGSSLTRFQVNLTPSNILTGGFLANLYDTSRSGLSFLTPAQATVDRRQTLFMTTIRDQIYFSGALLEMGFADSRGVLRYLPQGDQLYQITPLGNFGNYFVNLDRHFYRQQWIGNMFLPVMHWWGVHQLKFGVDFERESFHERDLLHDYEVVREDLSVARYVSFSGSPFASHKNFEGSQYLQDAWTPREGWTIEAGLRTEWNEVVRALEVAPRLAASWAPGALHGTKFSLGWGIYYDAINLGLITHPPGQVSLSTFFPSDGSPPQGPVTTSFAVNQRALEAPFSRTTSFAVEQKLPHAFYLRSGYMHRAGVHGLVFDPPSLAVAGGFQEGAVFQLSNSRHDWYNAVDLSLRRTFAARFEWFAGYTWSSARSNSAVNYSLQSPVYGPQGPGPYPWDATNRFHTWGWAPLPQTLLPEALRFLIRNTTVQYLVEYRTGFPFGVVDQQGFMVGPPNSLRFPAYFDINLAFERQFHAIHYLWAWRFGLNNLTNNGDPNVVNNIQGTPQFLTYGRGQARAFNMRLRFLGRK